VAHVAQGFSKVEDGLWLVSVPFKARDLGESAGGFGENQASEKWSK
jgi:hypothetical protein